MDRLGPTSLMHGIPPYVNVGGKDMSIRYFIAKALHQFMSTLLGTITYPNIPLPAGNFADDFPKFPFGRDMFSRSLEARSLFLTNYLQGFGTKPTSQVVTKSQTFNNHDKKTMEPTNKNPLKCFLSNEEQMNLRAFDLKTPVSFQEKVVMYNHQLLGLSYMTGAFIPSIYIYVYYIYI